MYKKIIMVISLLLLTGCNTYYINNLSYEDIINLTIEKESNIYNTNNKGYKYYLPTEFTVLENNDYSEVLLSNNNKYYLNIDIVAYYYKNSMQANVSTDDYMHYIFNKNDKDGYLIITKNNDEFFVELCYNYAIIEVEVEEKDLRYAVSRSITILDSIKYNDLVIEKYIGDNDAESSETVYKIPSPKEKKDSKNVLKYIEETEDSEAKEENVAYDDGE